MARDREIEEGIALYEAGRSAPARARHDPAAADDAPWYPVVDPLPPLGVAVRVRWDVGRSTYICEAARMREPMAPDGWVWISATRFVRYADGAVEALPKPRVVRLDPACGETPEAWQPLKPSAWRVPLPPPLVVQARIKLPSMPPPMAGAAAVTPADGRAPWWLDPSEIVYAPAGHVTTRDAEGRICRALWSAAWIKVDRPRDKTFSAILAQLAREQDLDERRAMQDGSRSNLPWQPNGRDADDYLQAMMWFAAFVRESGTRKSRVVLWRAWHRPRPWRAIGQNLGVSGPRALELYRQAINQLTAIANDPARWANPELDRVRARNRRGRA